MNWDRRAVRRCQNNARPCPVLRQREGQAIDSSNPYEAPEAVNLEQEEEGQSLGAVRPGEEDPEEVGETERVQRSAIGEVLSDDVPDLVEKMEEMVKSGRIDTDAFIGEASHDDEPETFGEEAAAEVDGDREGEPDSFLR